MVALDTLMQVMSLGMSDNGVFDVFPQDPQLGSLHGNVESRVAGRAPRRVAPPGVAG